MEQKKILFVSHDANRAGSQLLLLQLLRLLKERGVPMHLLLCNGGELEAEFEEVVGVTRLFQTKKITTPPFTGKLLRKTNLLKFYEEHSQHKGNERVLAELEQQNIGLIFINSIANAEVYYDFLKSFHDLPLVLFVHELAMSVKIYTQEEQLSFLLKKTDHLIAVSNAVADHYIRKYDFPAAHVSTFTLIDHEHRHRAAHCVPPSPGSAGKSMSSARSRPASKNVVEASL